VAHESSYNNGVKAVEDNIKDEVSREKGRQQTANEDLDHLLDSIDTEFGDLWDVALPEESAIKDVALGDNGELADLNPEISEGDDLELDLEATDDSGGSSNESEPKDGDSKTEMDTSLDKEDGNGKMMDEKEITGRASEDTSLVGSSNELASIMGNKIEEVVTRLVEERMSTIGKPPSKDISNDQTLKSVLKGQGDADSEKPDLDTSANELAGLMSERMEAITTRLMEEQMPAIVERTILETMKKILLSME